ncbi:hypothetical protein H0H92_014735 [Tricholoma furcatifolium]|nr:hypothetical protein H0H92_014735 [Tricholoma furcatifolium]
MASTYPLSQSPAFSSLLAPLALGGAKLAFLAVRGMEGFLAQPASEAPPSVSSLSSLVVPNPTTTATDPSRTLVVGDNDGVSPRVVVVFMLLATFATAGVGSKYIRTKSGLIFTPRSRKDDEDRQPPAPKRNWDDEDSEGSREEDISEDGGDDDDADYCDDGDGDDSSDGDEYTEDEDVYDDKASPGGDGGDPDPDEPSQGVSCDTPKHPRPLMDLTLWEQLLFVILCVLNGFVLYRTAWFQGLLTSLANLQVVVHQVGTESRSKAAPLFSKTLRLDASPPGVLLLDASPLLLLLDASPPVPLLDAPPPALLLDASPPAPPLDVPPPVLLLDASPPVPLLDASPPALLLDASPPVPLSGAPAPLPLPDAPPQVPCYERFVIREEPDAPQRSTFKACLGWTIVGMLLWDGWRTRESWKTLISASLAAIMARVNGATAFDPMDIAVEDEDGDDPYQDSTTLAAARSYEDGDGDEDDDSDTSKPFTPPPIPVTEPLDIRPQELECARKGSANSDSDLSMPSVGCGEDIRSCGPDDACKGSADTHPDSCMPSVGCGPGLPDEIQGAMFGVNGDDGDDDEDGGEEGWLINANEYYEEDPEEMEAEENIKEGELDGASKSIPAAVQDEGWLINANEYYEEDPEEMEGEEDVEEGELDSAGKSIPALVQDEEWEDPNDETILDPAVIREGFAAMYRVLLAEREEG